MDDIVDIRDNVEQVKADQVAQTQILEGIVVVLEGMSKNIELVESILRRLVEREQMR